MAMIQCSECKQQVSSKAKTCPNCGFKVKNPTPKAAKYLLYFTLFFFGLVFISAIIDDGDNRNNTSEVDPELQEYIDRNIEKFANKQWPFLAHEVAIGCFNDIGQNAVLRVESGENAGKFYALNGTASKHLPSSNEVGIPLDNSTYPSTSHLIEIANEICTDKKNHWYLVKFNPETDMLNMSIHSEKIETPRQKTLKNIEGQFSGWNGEHRNLAKFIKLAMHDPDSYEHDETVYWIMNDHLVVRTTYRGNNAFGAKIRNVTKAKISFDGTILEIQE